ncbi:hypothetical protein ACTS9D_12045 [Empedobacter brevis]
MPVIASPYISIGLTKNKFKPVRPNVLLSSENIIKQNTLFQTATLIEKQTIIRESTSKSGSYFIEYKLIPDDKFNYIPLN